MKSKNLFDLWWKEFGKDTGFINSAKKAGSNCYYLANNSLWFMRWASFNTLNGLFSRTHYVEDSNNLLNSARVRVNLLQTKLETIITIRISSARVYSS